MDVTAHTLEEAERLAAAVQGVTHVFPRSAILATHPKDTAGTATRFRAEED